MVGVDKDKITKKDEKEEIKAKAGATRKSGEGKASSSAKISSAPAKKTSRSSTRNLPDTNAAMRKEAMAAKLKARREARRKKQEEVLHAKTHQDLINAAYAAAEKIGIAPWVLLRAAKWGHFTEDRGKMYDGPILDDIDTLTVEQREALKDVLELK